MDVEFRLREALLPVFGLDSVEEVSPEASLVKDLGADSLDFVEIIYFIERDFGVVLKISELLPASTGGDLESYFTDGKLNPEGAAALNQQFGDRFQPGMSKMALLESISVRDLAGIIQRRMERAA